MASSSPVDFAPDYPNTPGVSSPVHLRGWGGPCPPTGEHQYAFRLYALDVPKLGLVSPTKQQLERVIEGHVLAEARLSGTYRRAAR